MSPIRYDQDGRLNFDVEREDWEREQRRENEHGDFPRSADPDHRHPLPRAVEDDPWSDY